MTSPVDLSPSISEALTEETALPDTARNRVVDTYDLSPMQAGMLFHTVGDGTPGVDIEQIVITLREPLDGARFVLAWEGVTAQHPILRSRFRWKQLSHPVQDVFDRVRLPVCRLDWQLLPPCERAMRFKALLHEDRLRGFVLDQAPLQRLTLVRMGEAEHWALWTFHHALLDGRSFPLVLREIFRCYDGLACDVEVDLPPSRPYRHYIEWLQRLDHARAREYWQRVLSGFRAPTPLIGTRERQPERLEGRPWGSHEATLSPALTAALEACARASGVTLNNLLQAAWGLLLHHYSGEHDIVFGVTRACRKSAAGGADDMVGLFINTLPLRMAVDPEAELATWLRTLHAQQLAMREYEHTPLIRIQGWSEVPRGTPLFESLLVYEHRTLDAQMRSPGGAWNSRRFSYYGQTNFPLTVVAYGGEEILLQLQYSRQRFDDAAAARMLQHLQTLLDGMAAGRHARLKELPLLSQSERLEALFAWNPTQKYDREESLQESFERQVGRTPHAVALVCEGERLSYAELNRRANRVAHRLRGLGAKPDELVGLHADRGIDMVVGIIAILKSGAAYLPLDPTYPKDRVAFMVEDSGVAVVLTQGSHAEALDGMDVRRILLDEPMPGIETNPPPLARPDHLAYVIYTSGSTGRPKGALITHYNVARLFQATRAWYGFDEQDVWTLFHSYAFDFSVWELWGALLHGGRVVIVPYWVSRSPDAFRELLIRERVTVLNQTPSAFRQLAQADLSAPKADLALRYVIFGGEALELQSLRPWIERYGDNRPLLVNMYGITETTVHVTYRPIRLGDLDAGQGSVIGQPIPDLRVYLLDARREPVPIGVPGELYVGGAGVARGYLNRPELTAERFIQDPFGGDSDARLYRTGDLARRLENGDIEYLGRIDHQVKIRGFRIELGEIEAAIARHPCVREVVVVAREDAPGDRRLVAYLVAQEPEATLVEQARASVAATMPDYMVPAHFVMLDALPLTENGKVDRKALPAPSAKVLAGRRYAEPRNAAEKAIAAVWRSVLGLERVGVDDNFFELGGDSILSIQVVARCRDAGLHLTSRDLFCRPTIAQLAEITRQQASAISAPQDDAPAGAVALTPIQRWFTELSIAERHHWNQAFLFEVPADADLDALENALSEVVNHHDAFRLRLWQTGSQWVLSYAEERAVAVLARIDLSGMEGSGRTATLEAHAARIQASLDLEQGPLLRAAHFSLGPGERGRLLIVIHHLAVDGVSWRLLREDLESAYWSLKQGHAPVLTPKSASFQRWAEQLQQFAHSERLKASLDHWEAEARKPVAPLPALESAVPNAEGEALALRCGLNREDTRKLLQEVPSAYHTQINDVLLTALALALQSWSAGEAFRIDLESHGREELFEGLDLSRTVGWFTSLYPVRLELPRGLDMAAALKSIKEQLRSVPDRGLSYGVLRYCGDPSTRDALAQCPRPDLLFNYLGQLDQLVAGSRLLRFASESSGPWRSAGALRSHRLEVLCAVRNGEFEAQWIHHPAIHSSETMAALAQDFIESLRRIIRHCLSADIGGRTPSDFPLAALDQACLDDLWQRYPGFEDVYPLSPIQRLFHVMESSRPSIGVECWRFRASGDLDSRRLRTAVEATMQRHAILRSAFVSPDNADPVQVVLPKVSLAWSEEDWRSLPPAQIEACLQELTASEMRAGFDLGRPPLFRMALRRSADDAWEIMWSTHHLCVDGWSWPLIFRDISGTYDALETGSIPQRDRPGAYRDYIAWLHQAAPDSEPFWRRSLAGFTAPTAINIGASPANGWSLTPGEISCRLDAASTAALQSLGRTHRVTVSTVVQSAWALLLSHYSGTLDVVFGAAFSGRPPELPGIDTLVGPCVNNIPVRTQVLSDAPLPAWLALAQAHQFELTQNQYTPLERIQKWSAVPWRSRLFDSLFVFQNYRVGDEARSLGKQIELVPVSVPESTNYPLTVAVTPGSELAVRFLYQPDRFMPDTVRTYATDLTSLLRAIAAQPERKVREFLALLPRSTYGAATAQAASGKRSAAPYVAPGTDMERAVASLWQELLGVERVSLDDNFFDLGGHSLLLVEAHGRLRDLTQRELPIIALLQYPTIRGLARHLSTGADATYKAPEAAERARKHREAIRRQRLNAGMR